MTLAAGAQGRVLALAQVLEGDAVAGALAAGLVVPPQDPQACALQHIEKAFLGARASVAVVRAAQVGEHAGHRHRGLGTAGVHVGEVDQALLGLQPRVGLASVAVEAEVLRPRALTHHQHGQRLARMALPQVGAPGIDGDRPQRLAGGLGLALGVADGGADQVARGDLQAQFLVVAEQRGQPLVIGQRHPGEQRQAGERHQQLAQQLAWPRPVAHRRAPQQPDRQRAKQRQVDGELRRKQVGDLGRVGLHDVAQHADVHQHAVLGHEVGGAGGRQDQQGQRRLEQPAERQQGQRQVEDRGDHQADRQHHAEALPARRGDRQQALPQRQVVEQQEGEADQQGQQFGTDGAGFRHGHGSSLTSGLPCAALPLAALDDGGSLLGDPSIFREEYLQKT